jgi:predicted phage terminase large subunit-like protein
MNTYKDKELYINKLYNLVSIKRKKLQAQSPRAFNELYLGDSLMPAASPEFHKQMTELLRRTVIMSTSAASAPYGVSTSAASTNNEIDEPESADEGTLSSSSTDVEVGKDKALPYHHDPGGTPLTISSEPTHFPDKNNNPIHRLLFIAPRGFAKSTVCSVSFGLWVALNFPNMDIFLVSATMSLAKEILRKIRAEIEGNEKILKDFGDVKSDKWTEDTIMLRNGSILRAKGRGFQIRGFRPSLIICDDLEDEEVIYSKDQRDKLEHWFFRTLLPALKPEQSVIYVGTKLHRSSLISKLQEKPEFEAHEWKALMKDQSIWEEWWPTKALKALRKEIGEYAFQAEYQNNPLSLTDQPIKPHMLEAKVTGEAKVACLGWDPAISEKESADYRAFAIFEKTETGFREVFSDRGRWGVEEQVDRVIDLYKRYEKQYDNFRVLIEEIAFQKVLRDLLLEKSRSKGIYIPVSTAEMGRGDKKIPRDKMTRLLSIAHLFEQKLVEVKNPDLKEELLAFPSGDYDDMVDATVHSLYWLMKYRTGFAVVKSDVEVFTDKKKALALHEIRPGVWMTKDGPIKGLETNQQNFYNVDKP